MSFAGWRRNSAPRCCPSRVGPVRGGSWRIPGLGGGDWVASISGVVAHSHSLVVLLVVVVWRLELAVGEEAWYRIVLAGRNW